MKKCFRLSAALAACGLALAMAGCNNSSDDNTALLLLMRNSSQSSAPTKTGPLEVGDVVLRDGMAVAKADISKMSAAQKNDAIAVIFHVGTDVSNVYASISKAPATLQERTLGVGLARATKLNWCSSTAAAKDIKITSVACQPSGDPGNYTFPYSGRDGSKNLEKIKEAANDSDDSDDAQEYPAFYFAKNYASQTGSHVSGTNYASGWYLPSVAELFQIWKEKEAVDAALSACGVETFAGAAASGPRWHLSSTQNNSGSSYDGECALMINFLAGNGGGTDDGAYGEMTKDNSAQDWISICAIREF